MKSSGASGAYSISCFILFAGAASVYSVSCGISCTSALLFVLNNKNKNNEIKQTARSQKYGGPRELGSSNLVGVCKQGLQD